MNLRTAKKVLKQGLDRSDRCRAALIRVGRYAPRWAQPMVFGGRNCQSWTDAMLARLIRPYCPHLQAGNCEFLMRTL